VSIFKRIERALRPLGGVIKGAVGALPGGQAVLMAREALISTRKVNQGVVPRTAVLPGRGAVQMGRQLGTRSPSLQSPFARQTMALTGAFRSPAQLSFRGEPMGAAGGLGEVIAGGFSELIQKRQPMSLQGKTSGRMTTGTWDMEQPWRARTAPRKRRAKGITATQLKAFTRVTALLNKYCKTPPPTKRRSASRGKACR
jgi:hypothetical protein